jgi:AAA domain
LDDPALAAVVAADPDAALRRMPEPVLIDEWQEVPQVFGAVKRAVDDDPRPGRFLLTGSIEADLTTGMWPGIGRVVRAVLHGLTQREVSGAVTGPSLLELAVRGSLDAVRVPVTRLSVDDYVKLAVTSGFPEPALRLRPAAHWAWLDSYLDHVVTRDVVAAGQSRDPVRLRRYLEILGLTTAGLPTDFTLSDTAGIDRQTADAYDRLLTNLFLIDSVSTPCLPGPRTGCPDWRSGASVTWPTRPWPWPRRGSTPTRFCATATCSAACWPPSSPHSSAPRSTCSGRGPGSTTCALTPAGRRSTSSSISVATA